MCIVVVVSMLRLGISHDWSLVRLQLVPSVCSLCILIQVFVIQHLSSQHYPLKASELYTAGLSALSKGISRQDDQVNSGNMPVTMCMLTPRCIL